MAIDLSDPSTQDLFVIISHGAIIGLFAYLPFWLIIRRELDKFNSQSANEHQAGRSIYSFFLTALIILALSNMLYATSMAVLEYIFPDYSPIYGDSGITRAFWDIELIVPSDDSELSLEKVQASIDTSLYKSIGILREILKGLSVVLVIVLLVLASSIAWSAIGGYQDDSQRNSLVSTLIKIAMSLTISAVILQYYSKSTSWILNLPDEQTLSGLSIEWITDAIDMATVIPPQ